MPETSASIGIQRDLTVRLGNTLRPQVLALSLTTGTLAGGRVRASIFRSQADMTPLAAPNPTFDVTQLEPLPNGGPRWRIELDKERVKALAQLAAPTTVQSGSAKKPGVRTLYWTCSYETDDGTSYPIYYGKLNIYLGATSG